MKTAKLIKGRYLEILIAGILVTKLVLAVFPLVSKKVGSISLVTDSLAVSDAIAKENGSPSGPSEKTILASNDSSKPDHLVEKGTRQELLVPMDSDIDLEKIREDLVKREALLKEREKKLEALRASVEKELAQLLTIQSEIKAHLEKQVEEREAKSKYLAKMYSSMKAKKAAKLLVELDEALAVRVLKLMKPEVAGQILTYLDPKKAARLTKEFYYK